jgi:hypothetical protein
MRFNTPAAAARRGPSRRNTVSPSSTDQGGGKLAVNIDQTAKSESNAA